MHTFNRTLPPPVTNQQLADNNKKLTIDDVEQWIVRGGGIQGRFRFFETFARNNEFYLKVAKPLLSLCTTGSIDVERRTKPINHTIMTKKHNRLMDPKGVALFRASENLKHIMKAKKSLGKKITVQDQLR